MPDEMTSEEGWGGKELSRLLADLAAAGVSIELSSSGTYVRCRPKGKVCGTLRKRVASARRELRYVLKKVLVPRELAMTCRYGDVCAYLSMTVGLWLVHSHRLEHAEAMAARSVLLNQTAADLEDDA